MKVYAIISADGIEAMNRAITAAALRPVIDRCFDVDQARDADHQMRAAGHLGKLVVSLAD